MTCGFMHILLQHVMLVASMLLWGLQVSAQGFVVDNNDEPKANAKPPKVYIYTVKGVEFTMVTVEGGVFQMGSDSGGYDEQPAHEVKLKRFSIGQTEVTQELWEAVMDTNPSAWKGAKYPVESVSWDDCQQFIKKLNRLTGRRFRLPKEAEWEFAARGGNLSQGYTYSGSNNINDVAWCDNGIYSRPHKVATKEPNELGIYDMSGNVWEWCHDWYYDDYYFESPIKNPPGPFEGTDRVIRGGSWGSIEKLCRVIERNYYFPEGTGNIVGFRLAL